MGMKGYRLRVQRDGDGHYRVGKPMSLKRAARLGKAMRKTFADFKVEILPPGHRQNPIAGKE